VIYLLTLSNKPDLLVEACASVAAQTRLHDVVHLVQRDQGRDWGGRYPPSVFINEVLAVLPRDSYWSFLADDDLMLPSFVADLAGYLDEHPDAQCVYGGGTVVLHDPPKPDQEMFRFPAEAFIGKGQQAIWRVGSGMSMARVGASLEIGRYPEDAEPQRARICDGIWLQRMAERFGLHPTHTWVTINRMTRRSAHAAVDARGQFAVTDWRRLRTEATVG
jgi:hypothetical protein